MDRINLPKFYNLANKLAALVSLAPDDVRCLGDVFLRLITAKEATNKMLETFPSPSLTVCRPQGLELVQLMNDLYKSWSNVPFSEWSDPLEEGEKWPAWNVINKAKAFETVLLAELETIASYYVTQKGAYSTLALIETTEMVFPETVKALLTEEIKEEVRQSGRCLALDNPTASGFHIMRATESVIRLYYQAVCEKSTTAKLDNWGSYISALRDTKEPGALKVSAMLQQIKDQDRNLIMHPEMVLSADEALGLFEVAKAAMIVMMSELNSRASLEPTPLPTPAISPN